jgi:hypothetical protein
MGSLKKDVIGTSIRWGVEWDQKKFCIQANKEW